MPNAKVLEQKKQIVADLAHKMQNAAAGVLVDYQGITVEADTKLRRALREAGVEYSVVKNTLTRFAANQIGFEALDEKLNGVSALAISMEDPIAPARIINDFMKKKEKEKFLRIKAGFVEGKLVDEAEIKRLAELPSREGMIAQVLYGFNYPITQLVIALDAIAKKFEGMDDKSVSELVAAAAVSEAASEPAAE